MHPYPVRVFVSYHHADAPYLKDGSLLDYLKGLEQEGVEFWADPRLVTGELWDDVIKQQVADCDIALVLVSQRYLDSKYCKDIEIRGFLGGFKVLIPVILSACEWERHDWLKSRQFLPGGQRTIEEHYRDQGDRKRLFHEIRTHLREQIERVRTGRMVEPASPVARTVAVIPPNPFGQVIKDPTLFVGRQKELSQLRALLQLGSVALLGKPKTGKSSLLRQLAQSWPGEVIGPVDFEAIEGLEEYYSDLAARLKLEASDWRTIRKAMRERRLLLLLDELDKAPGRGFDGEALGRLRAVSGLNPGFQVVAVSRNPLKSVFPDSGLGSPVYSFLQPFTVGALCEEDARDLLAHPWAPEGPSFDSATADQLLMLSERHPFKLQRAAFHRYEALSDSGRDWLAAWQQDMENML